MIKSLQGLRVISMIIIFMWHCGFSNFNAKIPVTFFFILSGFLAYITYKDKKEESIIKSSIEYCKRKLKKLYPIHIVTFLISVPLRIKLILNNFGKEIIVMITHLLLLQSIIPVKHFYFNYNESSWYISTLVFCYIFTSVLIRGINKIQNTNNKMFRAILILIATFIIQIILSKIFNDTKLAQWILYISPFNRILDYFMGILVGFIYLNKKENINLSKNIMSLFEILIIGIIVMDYIYPMDLYYKVNIRPFILIGVFIFSLEKGVLSRILSHKIFIYFAEFSFEFFMIHMTIIIICGKISQILGLNRIITVSFSFIISIILAKILNIYVNKSQYKVIQELRML